MRTSSTTTSDDEAFESRMNEVSAAVIGNDPGRLIARDRSFKSGKIRNDR